MSQDKATDAGATLGKYLALVLSAFFTGNSDPYPLLRVVALGCHRAEIWHGGSHILPIFMDGFQSVQIRFQT